MSNAELPIFLIALGGEWLAQEVGPDLISAFAFGTRGDAQAYLEHAAEVSGKPAALYRVVEYTFSGNVSEG